MESILTWLSSLLPASIVSFVVGFFSCMTAQVLFMRSKHYARWLKEQITMTVDDNVSYLKESNARHSLKIQEIEKRLVKLEEQNDQILPKIDTMSKEITEIYRLMIKERR